MDSTWNFASRLDPQEGDLTNQTLELGWSLHLDNISDGFQVEAAPAGELFAMWLEKIGDVEELPISWVVAGLGDAAPFAGHHEDFLTHYTWPRHAETGERLNWLTLPVLSKGWNGLRDDQGGFIQEVTGWKPSALQRTVHIPTLLMASGWK